MKKFYLFGVIACVAVYAFGVVIAGGKFNYFIDPATFVIVVLPAVIMALSHHGPVEITRAFSIAGASRSASAAEYKKAILLFKSFKEYLVVTSFIGVFMGIVLMLSGFKVDNSNSDMFGKGLAACLISVLYAAFLILIVVCPFKNALEVKLNEIEG